MAKATKTKKEKPVNHTAEVTHSGLTETVPISDEGIIEVTPIEPEITEVKEVVEPVIEKKKEEVGTTDTIVEEKVEIPAYVFEEKPLISEKLELLNGNIPVYGVEQSIEEKILSFVESRNGEIKMNDFLKSLYGVPKFGEPATWLSQRASKELRATLSKLSNEGFLNIVSNAHMKLGTFYYPDTTTGKTSYHNLNTVSIICVK